MDYNWKQKEWPNYRYEKERLKDELSAFAEAHACVRSAYERVMSAGCEEEGIVTEAVQSSAIEGVKVDAGVILSSVCRVMGMPTTAMRMSYDSRSEGVAALMMDIRRDWNRPISRDLLLFWHRDLMREFPSAGEFRSHSDAMLLVRRDAYGEMNVRYEAPPSSRMETEVAQFVRVMHAFDAVKDVALRASLGHLYFETIHPFEDGNGRVGRALVAKMLAESIGVPVVLPISSVIEASREAYYEALRAGSFTLDWTPWAAFFIPILTQTMRLFVQNVDFVLQKRAYLLRWSEHLSERELKVIKRMFHDGTEDVALGLSAAKYQRMTKVSKPTATRDLAEMCALGALVAEGEGRGRHYHLPFESAKV